MVKTNQSGKPLDFSIMPSFECNLRCWFCMYDCSPENHTTLDYTQTRRFLASVDWSLVNTCGFYGGEPSINMPLYDTFIALVPSDLPRFVISNGAWSRSVEDTRRFLVWCNKNRFHVIVSSTPEHVAHQDRLFLENIEKEFNGSLVLKEPDEIHAQGRAGSDPRAVRDCKQSCKRTDRNMRLGLRPDGWIVYQNCHGEYIRVQSYLDVFDGIIERATHLVEFCPRRTKQ